MQIVSITRIVRPSISKLFGMLSTGRQLRRGSVLKWEALFLYLHSTLPILDL
jgi:hypothetical protein